MQFISQLLEHPSLLAYFSGASNYTWLQFQNGERRLLAKPLVYFEERLPGFIRVHRTALVNPACVVSIQQPPRPKMSGSVRMHDGIELPVSRRRWNDVVQLLQTTLDETNPTGVVRNGLPGFAERVSYVPPERTERGRFMETVHTFTNSTTSFAGYASEIRNVIRANPGGDCEQLVRRAMAGDRALYRQFADEEGPPRVCRDPNP